MQRLRFPSNNPLFIKRDYSDSSYSLKFRTACSLSTVHLLPSPSHLPIISSTIPSLAREMNESCSLQASNHQKVTELWFQAQRLEERNLACISQQFFTDSKSLVLAPFQRQGSCTDCEIFSQDYILCLTPAQETV